MIESQISVFTKKVLLEHSHIHSFIHSVTHCYFGATVEQRLSGPQGYLLPGPLQKKSASPHL